MGTHPGMGDPALHQRSSKLFRDRGGTDDDRKLI